MPIILPRQPNDPAILLEVGEAVNKNNYFTIQAFLILLLAVVIPTQARGEKPVMAGVAGPAVNLVYAYLAQDAGLWRKHGLDVRIILFEAGSTLAQVARTGDVSFAINSGPTTIASRTQGADAIIIAAAVNTLPYSLVTTKSILKW